MNAINEALKLSTQDHGVLRFITAGSVDDGKSTLIGRLLFDSKGIFADQLAAISKAKNKRTAGDAIDFSLLTDGLEAEREKDGRGPHPKVENVGCTIKASNGVDHGSHTPDRQ